MSHSQNRTYQYPKINVPTKSLVVADLKSDKMDGQIAACVLQDIVNKQSPEKNGSFVIMLQV